MVENRGQPLPLRKVDPVERAADSIPATRGNWFDKVVQDASDNFKAGSRRMRPDAVVSFTMGIQPEQAPICTCLVTGMQSTFRSSRTRWAWSLSDFLIAVRGGTEWHHSTSRVWALANLDLSPLMWTVSAMTGLSPHIRCITGWIAVRVPCISAS